MYQLQRGGIEERDRINSNISICQLVVINWQESPAHDFDRIYKAIKVSSQMWIRVAGTVTIYLFY